MPFAQPPQGATSGHNQTPTPGSLRSLRTEIERHEIPASEINAVLARRVEVWDSLKPAMDHLAVRPAHPPNSMSFAWHLLDAPLEEFVSAYPHLRRRGGYQIRSYVLFRRGRLVAGLPFAVVEGVSPPEPWSCIDYSAGGGTPEPYFDGMSCFLNVLDDGADGPVEYLSASLFARDVYNFAGGLARWRDVVMESHVVDAAVLSHHRVGDIQYRRLDFDALAPDHQVERIHDVFNPAEPGSLYPLGSPNFRSGHRQMMLPTEFYQLSQRQEVPAQDLFLDLPF